jgi:hypothetical protein
MQLGGRKNFFGEFWNIWECLSVEEIRGATQMPTQSFFGEFRNIWECLDVEEIRGATQMPTKFC